MSFSVSCRKGARRAGLLCLMLFFLPACSLFTKAEPEADLLEQRTKAFIDVGWLWLHAENVRFLRGYRQGDRYLGVFEYDIVSDAEMDLLTDFEKERFSTFLPMCAGRTITVGSRCRIVETVPFINSNAYGWIPELALGLSSDQLSVIIGKH